MRRNEHWDHFGDNTNSKFLEQRSCCLQRTCGISLHPGSSIIVLANLSYGSRLLEFSEPAFRLFFLRFLDMICSCRKPRSTSISATSFSGEPLMGILAGSKREYFAAQAVPISCLGSCGTLRCSIAHVESGLFALWRNVFLRLSGPVFAVSTSKPAVAPLKVNACKLTCIAPPVVFQRFWILLRKERPKVQKCHCSGASSPDIQSLR